METGQLDRIRDVLTALFASITYTRGDDPFENYFQAVIYLVFTLLGKERRKNYRETDASNNYILNHISSLIGRAL